MKKQHLFFLLAIISILMACSTARESAVVWVNTEKIQGKSFNKIFVIVLTKDLQARTKLENDLATAAMENGYQAVKSINAIGPLLQEEKALLKEEIVKKVKESGCDAVFVASLLKKEEKERYVSGNTAYIGGGYYGYYGFYNHWYPTVATEGYYTKENNYFMQSNLYDVASEDAMWSVQSTIFDPSNLNRFSKTYMASVIKQLESKGLLNK